MAGLDPAISYPHQIANDAIPISNHPKQVAGAVAPPSPRWQRAQYAGS
jgi:hypothetical protein